MLMASQTGAASHKAAVANVLDLFHAAAVSDDIEAICSCFASKGRFLVGREIQFSLPLEELRKKQKRGNAELWRAAPLVTSRKIEVVYPEKRTTEDEEMPGALPIASFVEMLKDEGRGTAKGTGIMLLEEITNKGNTEQSAIKSKSKQWRILQYTLSPSTSDYNIYQEETEEQPQDTPYSVNSQRVPTAPTPVSIMKTPVHYFGEAREEVLPGNDTSLVSKQDSDPLDRRSTKLVAKEVWSKLSRAARKAVSSLGAVSEDLPGGPFENEDEYEESANRRRRRILCWSFIIFMIVFIVWISIAQSNKGDKESVQIDTLVPTTGPQLPNFSPTISPTIQRVPTYESVLERNTLRCGISGVIGFGAVNSSTERREGMSVDLCQAVAAVLNEKINIELVVVTTSTRFTSLADNSVDLLLSRDTITMERDVHQFGSEAGFSFSIPYLYDGLSFGGIPFFVSTCADKLVITGQCKDLVICIQSSTTHRDTISPLISGGNLILTDSLETMYQLFAEGNCNVIAGEQFDIAESTVRRMSNYTGEFQVGSKLLSKEPLGLVTRDDDAQWSNIVGGVMQILIAAEEKNITKRQSQEKVYQPSNFMKAIEAVGNYGEIYERHLENLVPRKGLNLLNKKRNSGLIYSHPFGSIQNSGPGAVQGGTLDKILNRGTLRCGISRREGFGEIDSRSNQTSTGLDADLCRAVSASVFNGKGNSTTFVDLPNDDTERFLALSSGRVDILTGGNFFLDGDILDLTFDRGLSFSLPYYYNDLQFGGLSPFVDECADMLDVTSPKCSSLKICVVDESIHNAHLQTLFSEEFIVAVERDLLIQSLDEGKCNVIAGSMLYVSEASANSTGFQMGTNQFSKYSASLVTYGTDSQWSAFVRWIVIATFYAEEEKINRFTSSKMPLVNLFGIAYTRMLRDAIAAAGDYGEMYDRNLRKYVPRSGKNLLNDVNPYGGQHFSLLDVREE